MGLFGGGTTTTSQTSNQTTGYNPDAGVMSDWQNIKGTAGGLTDYLINNGMQYPGQQVAGPTGSMQDWWNRTQGQTNAPDMTGLQRGMTDIGSAMVNQYRDPNQVNLPQNFNFRPDQINLPQFGNTPQVGMPQGGPSGLASSYMVNPQQVSGPTVSAERVSAPGAIEGVNLSGLERVYGPQLQQYQMGPYQAVNAPNLRDFQMQAAGNVAPQAQVGAQSWTDPGTAAQFMGPYTQQVLDAQKQNMSADYAAQQVAQHSQAAKAGAFGGTRQAVQDAESQRNLNLQMQNVEAQGLQSAYQQAQQQFNQQQQLGMQGQQFNVQSGMQAALANQANQQQANLQNLSAYLQTQGLGAQTGLQAQLANQQAGLTVGQQNLGANLQTQGLGAQLGMQASLANQQQGLQAQLANLEARKFGASQEMQASLANQQSALQAALATGQMGMQGQLANQAAGIQTGLAAQQLGFQGSQFNAQQGMQAALANQAAQMQGMGMQYQGGLSAALQGQQLGMQGQIAGGQLGLQGAQQQEALRQAQQGMNLQGFNQAANVYNQSGQLGLQGFGANLAGMGMQQQGALSQQGYEQQKADTNYQTWLMNQMLPFQANAYMANIMGQAPLPYTQTQTGSSTGTQTVPGPGIGGFLGSVLGGVGSVMTGLGGAGGLMKAVGSMSGAKGGLAIERDGVAAIVPFRPPRKPSAKRTGLGTLLRAKGGRAKGSPTKTGDDEDSVWDKAARGITDTQAQSRFTRTPITIKNNDAIFREGVPSVEESPSTGEYMPDIEKSYVNLYGRRPTYQELQRTIHHEDIHALLDKAGIIAHSSRPQDWYRDLMDTQPQPTGKALRSLYLGQRAGSPTLEMPAYVGAFNPAEMPGFTEADRQAWLAQFKGTMPNDVADLYQRIIDNYQASQRPLPTTAR